MGHSLAAPEDHWTQLVPGPSRDSAQPVCGELGLGFVW